MRMRTYDKKSLVLMRDRARWEYRASKQKPSWRRNWEKLRTPNTESKRRGGPVSSHNPLRTKFPSILISVHFVQCVMQSLNLKILHWCLTVSQNKAPYNPVSIQVKPGVCWSGLKEHHRQKHIASPCVRGGDLQSRDRDSLMPTTDKEPVL